MTPRLLLLLAALAARPARAESLRLLDRNGLPLEEVSLSGEDIRYPVALKDVSPWAVLATLAAEDRRFFEHSGVDPRAAVRALWQNAASGRVVSGGSTITQQLVRNLEPRPRTLGGKLREAWSALRLERRRSKAAILEEYLNVVPYGNRAAGIEAASRLYLGKPASELSLAEAAYLAGIPRSPGRVNPYRGAKALKARQREILRRLRRSGWTTEEAHRVAMSERVEPLAPARGRPAPHFAERARRWALARGIVTGELRTTLDLEVQHAAAEALSAHLKSLRGNKVRNGAVLVIDNRTGGVLAWVGSQDFQGEGGQVDGVISRRQPGSALKPFVYGLALERGRTPADLLLDEPFTSADRFTPRNYDETFHGPVRLRESLACSYNVPVIRLGEELGLGTMLAKLRLAGFDSLDRPAGHYGLGLALGNGEVTLLELTRAYAALARGGFWLPETIVLGQASREGPPRRILTRQAAYLITDILSDNSARAPAFGFHSPFNVSFPLAAKTGTTKDYRDNWAVGYTPDWTVGVWVGNFDGKPMARVSGISGAGPVLRDVATRLWQSRGARPFPVPPGIREAAICPVSGKLPGPWCPATMVERFETKRLPSERCGVHAAPSPAARAPRTGAPAVAFPRSGDIFKLDPTYSASAQRLKLKAEGVEPSERVSWSVDGRLLPESQGGAWWDLSPGDHHVQVSVLRGAGWVASEPVHIFIAAPR